MSLNNELNNISSNTRQSIIGSDGMKKRSQKCSVSKFQELTNERNKHSQLTQRRAFQGQRKVDLRPA